MLISNSFHRNVGLLVCSVTMGGHLYVSAEFKLLPKDTRCLAFAVILIFMASFIVVFLFCYLLFCSSIGFSAVYWFSCRGIICCSTFCGVVPCCVVGK
jgi:hypothetical protein